MTVPHPRFALGAWCALVAVVVLLGGTLPLLFWGLAVLLAATQLAVLARVPFSPAERRLVVLFAAAVTCWLLSDAVRIHSAPKAVLPLAEVLAGAGSVLFTAVIAWVVQLRGPARIETWLDTLIFVAALLPPLWLGVIEPASADATTFPWVVAWSALTLVLLGLGGVYVMSGGHWNVPAVLLALGVVLNTVLGVALLVGDWPGAVNVPHHLPGLVLWLFVGLHPGLLGVFQPGKRPSGIPLSARVFMLVPAVSAPLLALGWCYVQDRPVPVAVLGVSLVLIYGLVGIRAYLLARAGIRDWSVPLTISATALLVVAVAVSLSLLSQSARRAQNVADAYAREATAALALPAQAAGGGSRTIDAQQRARVAAVSRGIADRQATARSRSETVRLFTAGTLVVTLFLVAVLLLRFNRARRRLELQHQKTHDELTGLPNRLSLDRSLQEGAGIADAAGSRTLVLLDLDDFKAINDSLGHSAGDAVLLAIAGRLEATLKSDHLLVRTDGDAFAILVPAGQDALAVAHRVLATLATPIELDGAPHVICASIGIAEVSEADAQRAASVFRDAELAMYQAKLVSGNSIETFVSDMHQRARDRIQLAAELRDALENDGLHLVYQPIVDLLSGGVRGYEALIRWNHPERGPMSPAEFIPLAERSGLIVDIGGWVLQTATQQLADWQRQWDDHRYISVNVAASQLATRALEQQVRDALEASGLGPERLLLEVTESSLIEDFDASAEQMTAIRAMGVKFALDDFGTGYSSLSYLRRFPLDVLKVDKSFIDALHEVDGTLLVRAIINMATSLRLQVVAEGIEEREQAAMLQEFGCGLAQGFHFSRPLPADDVGDKNQRTFEVPVRPTLRIA